MFDILTAYKFVRLTQERVDTVESELYSIARKHEVMGLIILGVEGINFTLAQPKTNTEAFLKDLLAIPEFDDLTFKNSKADKAPFKRFIIKQRAEIVSLNKEEYFPDRLHKHLKPKEWHEILNSDEDYVLIDTRNEYEVELGKFEGAVDPQVNMFQEFPEFIEKSEIPKDKKVLIYCTGGIRCEKAIYEFEKQGFENVYQLEGGILKYIEEYPNQKYEGECFVFDHRVAVNQDLKPSDRFHLCPHCGNPGDLTCDCLECGELAKVCKHCVAKSDEFKTCSKNCEHHFVRKRA